MLILFNGPVAKQAQYDNFALFVYEVYYIAKLREIARQAIVTLAIAICF